MARPRKSSDMAAIIDQAKNLVTALERFSNTVAAALQDAEILREFKPFLNKIKSLDTPVTQELLPTDILPAVNLPETVTEIPWIDGSGNNPDGPPAEESPVQDHKKKKK